MPAFMSKEYIVCVRCLREGHLSHACTQPSGVGPEGYLGRTMPQNKPEQARGGLFPTSQSNPRGKGKK